MDIDLKALFIPHMIDFKGVDFTQEVRLKKNQLNQLLLAYFRSTCKTKYFEGKPTGKRILISKPVNLEFERFCLQYYEELLRFLQANLEKNQSLESDLLTLSDSQT